MIKISDVANPDVSSINETPFTLCNLDLLSPNGSNFYRVGTPVEVTWDSDLVGDLTLSYKSCIDCDWVIIEEGVPADSNSYMWTPEIATTWCKIQLSETSFPEVTDESANIFFVFRLDLTSPEGGENIAGQSKFDINWESEIINSVKIEFSSDNGQIWNTVAGSVPASDSTYEWTVPNINSDECYIKLTFPDQADLYSINELLFSIYYTVGTESLPDTKGVDLNIFPNPIIDEVSISFLPTKEWNNSYKIEIYNVKGEMVLSQSEEIIQNGEQLLILDLESLSQGVYIIKIMDENKSISKKFVKN